jgi:hypothetical protein
MTRIGVVLSTLLFATSALPANAQEPAPAGALPGMAPTLPLDGFWPSAALEAQSAPGNAGDSEKGRFESDRAFPGFVGPISNAVLSKDPRSLTEARFVFINDIIPPDHPFHGGNFQVIGLEVRVALTDRLSFIADKDGYAWIHPGSGSEDEGWLNINVGLKYLLVRDVEDQFLWSAGFMYEPQTGEGAVFQSQGHGVMTAFTTAGKQFGDYYHTLGTVGYQFGLDPNQNSGFIYTSLHLDRQICGWFYPLVEMNWFHYVSGGDRGLPSALGEGDGLLNLGTSGVSGNDLVTVAGGFKAVLGDHLETGIAWEVPVSNRKDLIDNRLTFEVIFRY